MANFGRFVCVLLPFLLTLASLIAMLIAGLAGVADKSLFMFQLNTTGLSIDPITATNLISKATNGHGSSKLPDITKILDGNLKARQSQSSNITAEDLGLYNLYDVGIWTYCYTPKNGSRECTKAKFNWAENDLKTSTKDFKSFVSAAGVNVTLPKEITDAINIFSNVSRWTQVVFVITYIALGVALFFGLFANCSRAFSCITWLLAGFAAAAACASAALATATAVVVVGAVEASAKIYGIRADFNTRFLAVVWIGAAFAIGAAFFWLFTVCCCAPDHSSRKKRSRSGSDSGEKLMQGPYQRLEPQGQGYQGYQQQYPNQAYAAAGREAAYEPYSHSRV